MADRVPPRAAPLAPPPMATWAAETTAGDKTTSVGHVANVEHVEYVEYVEQIETLARERLGRELADLPPWGTSALWACVRGTDGASLSLGALAYLLSEARRRDDTEAVRALFTRLLARIEPGIQRWAASVTARAPGFSGLASVAMREDLCQELALRLWQRLALEPSEPWQLFFRRALDYERRHIATAYMERNGYWIRAARGGRIRARIQAGAGLAHVLMG